MSEHSRQVLVKVEGQEFLVEIEDISAIPIIANVDGRSYEVVVTGQVEKPQIQAVDRPVQPIVSARPLESNLTPVSTSEEGVVTAPMPGDIVEIHVRPGQHVGAGDELCVLDAMKMKNVIYASREGAIASVEVSVGQAVDYGAVLFTYE